MSVDLIEIIETIRIGIENQGVCSLVLEPFNRAASLRIAGEVIKRRAACAQDVEVTVPIEIGAVDGFRALREVAHDPPG